MSSDGSDKSTFFLSRKSAEARAKYAKSWGVETIALTMPIVLFMFLIVFSYDSEALSYTLVMLTLSSPFWLPLFLLKFLWVSWIDYIRYMFWFSQSMVLLEIDLPPEVKRSPLAMEQFLTALHNAGGETTFIDIIWGGKFRAIWSLEIASNEGKISFYIHVRKAHRNIIEARFYGQYPEAQLREVDDYVSKIDFNLDDYDLFAGEYKKDDPQAMPIKTYLDYELDRNIDEPQMQIDPLINILELMGSIGEGQYFWVQIIIKARKSDNDDWYGLAQKKKKVYADSMKEAIKTLQTGAAKRTSDILGKDTKSVSINLTDGEKKKIEALERHATKLVFDCGVRAINLGKRNKFNGMYSGGIVRLFDTFKLVGYNGVGLARGSGEFDYPWQDFGDILKNRVKRQQFFRYKHRAFFYIPYDQRPTLMTTEELATLWHLPSQAITTPGLQRLTSKTADAPTNIPV